MAPVPRLSSSASNRSPWVSNLSDAGVLPLTLRCHDKWLHRQGSGPQHRLRSVRRYRHRGGHEKDHVPWSQGVICQCGLTFLSCTQAPPLGLPASPGLRILALPHSRSPILVPCKSKTKAPHRESLCLALLLFDFYPVGYQDWGGEVYRYTVTAGAESLARSDPPGSDPGTPTPGSDRCPAAGAVPIIFGWSQTVSGSGLLQRNNRIADA